MPGYSLQRCHEEAPVGMWDALGIVKLERKDCWKSLFMTLWVEQRGQSVVTLLSHNRHGRAPALVRPQCLLMARLVALRSLAHPRQRPGHWTCSHRLGC